MANDWKVKAEKLRFEDGLSWTELAQAMQSDFPSLTLSQVREKSARPLPNYSAVSKARYAKAGVFRPPHAIRPSEFSVFSQIHISDLLAVPWLV